MEPCKACGTWKCADCGFVRYRASRYEKQVCARRRCRSERGRMVPTTHTNSILNLDHQEEVALMEKEGVQPVYPA